MPLYRCNKFAAVLLVLDLLAGCNAAAAPRQVLVYNQAEVQCHTGLELVNAIMNPNVNAVALMNDVTLEETDFPSARQSSGPILLNRNLSIRGVAAASLPVVLDFNFLRTKVALMGRILVSFKDLFMVNYRRGSATQQPGFDLFTVLPIPGQHVATVEMRDCFLVFRFCFPPLIANLSLSNLTRPSEIPGKTRAVVPYASSFLCTKGTSNNTLVTDSYAIDLWKHGCFKAASLFVDVAAYGGDMNDDNTPNLNSVSYPVQAFDTVALCADVLSYECISRLGPLGCLLLTERQRWQSPEAPPPAAAKAMSASPVADTASESSKTWRLPVILSCSIGGLMTVALGFVWLRRRRVGWRSLLPGKSTTKQDTCMEEHIEEGKTRYVVDFISEPDASPSTKGDIIQSAVLGDGELQNQGSEQQQPQQLGLLQGQAQRHEVFPPHQRQEQQLDHEDIKIVAVTGANGLSTPPPAVHILTPENIHLGPCHLRHVQRRGAVEAPVAASAAEGSFQDTGGARTCIRDESGWCNESAMPTAEQRALVPVTLITPLQPGINLNVRPDETALKLTGVTLGKGAFGRVVEGMYEGRRVAVKIIDDGLLVRSVPPPMPPYESVSTAAAVVAAAAARPHSCDKNDAGQHQPSINQAGRAALAGLSEEQQQEEVDSFATCTGQAQGINSTGAADVSVISNQDLTPMQPVGLHAMAQLLRAVCDDDQLCSFSNCSDGEVQRWHTHDHCYNAVAGAPSIQLLPFLGPTHAESAAAHGGQHSKIGCGGRSVTHCYSDDSAAGALVSTCVGAHVTSGGAAAGIRLTCGSEGAQKGDDDVPSYAAMHLHMNGPVQAVASVGILCAAAVESTGVSSTVAAATDCLKCAACNDSRAGDKHLECAQPGQSSSVDPPRPPAADNTVACHQAAVQPSPAGQQAELFSCLSSMLMQEVEVLARCHHPNIVRLLAACLMPPRFCLVMELMETSLDRMLHGGGGLLPLDTVLQVAIQIAQGLAYLHPTIVHRDLKPGNVLVSRADKGRPIVKLADFGLSRLRDTVLVTRNPEVGTAPYIAPEAFDILNNKITDRVDVYALGVILWEMLSGCRPWNRVNIVVIALNVNVYRKRPPLDRLPQARCPPKLLALIESCWEHIPERRPASAEVVKRLALIQRSHHCAPAAGPAAGPCAREADLQHTYGRVLSLLRATVEQPSQHVQEASD